MLICSDKEYTMYYADAFTYTVEFVIKSHIKMSKIHILLCSFKFAFRKHYIAICFTFCGEKQQLYYKNKFHVFEHVKKMITTTTHCAHYIYRALFTALKRPAMITDTIRTIPTVSVVIPTLSVTPFFDLSEIEKSGRIVTINVDRLSTFTPFKLCTQQSSYMKMIWHQCYIYM